ncbi:MAG: XRE family transcriptional regulator [Bacteroidetes bacterium]|nr:MAG: XRE family transcriptional regulator [Bacteroidota bacterium]
MTIKLTLLPINPKSRPFCLNIEQINYTKGIKFGSMKLFILTLNKTHIHAYSSSPPPPRKNTCRINNLFVNSHSQTTNSVATNLQNQPIMTLNERLYQIRKNYGYTQADIAYKLEISPQAYSQFERSAEHIKYTTLVRIAAVLQVPVSFLVDVENNIFRYLP